MKIGHVDVSKEVLVVAEIGNNHEGSVVVARNLVRRAAETGVQAVKFQTFRAEHLVSPVQKERFERLRGFELREDDFRALAKQARDLGLLFLSTPFDLQSARFLVEIVDAMKIASGDNTFYPLLEEVAASGKPVILSTGLADLPQIAYAKSLVERVWAERHTTQELAILHCVSAYPVPPEQANLAAISTLRDRVGGVVGYSDHTLGIRAAVLAVAAGARIVEKHFTLDTQYSSFRDHQLSADPEMMRRLVDEVREAERLLGNGAKEAQPCEQDGLVGTRRSVAAARNLPAGAIVDATAITWVRPGDGIPPGSERLVLGRVLRRAVAAGDVLRPDDFS